MRFGRVVVIAAALACLPACVEPTDEPHAASAFPIVGGTVDMGDPAVVIVLLENSAGDIVGICTGTLISPKIVLTAAHCVDAGSGASKWQVYFGYNPFGATDPTYLGLYDVVAKTIHPMWNPAALDNGHDLALLKLEAIGPTTPKPINRDPLTPSMIGSPVRLVGYGQTSASDTTNPTKRQATSKLDDYNFNLIVFGDAMKNTCQGDSGGPNFMTIGGKEVVVGVTSFGDPDCNQYGAGVRVDYYATSFIDPWVAANDTINCSADGGCATGCPSPDPDCPCAGDGHCTIACANTDIDPDCPYGCGANGNCVMTGCPKPDPDCGGNPPPPPDQCTADGACVTGCTPRDPDCPLGGPGERCAAGEDCASGICLTAPDDPDIRYCTAFCEPTAPDCPGGMKCVQTAEGPHICIFDGPTPGALGSACEKAEDCDSRICQPTANGNICIELCDPGVGCPGAFECVEASGGQHVCLPAGADPGEEERPWYQCGVRAGAAAGGRGPGAGAGAGAAVLLLAGVTLAARRR